MIIAGDLHLKPRTWATYKDLVGDSHFGLVQLVDASLRFDEELLLLGDIFDSSHPDAPTVNFFCEQIARMKKRCILIRGNHDHGEVHMPGVSPAWGANVAVHLELATYLPYNIGQREIFGLDARTRTELKEAMRLIPPYIRILAAHQSWDELQQVGDTNGTIADIPAHVQYLLTGDLHEHGVFQCRGGTLTAVSPGSTCMQNISEPADKAFFRMSAHGDQLHFESVPLRTRAVFRILVAVEADLAKVQAALDNYIFDPELPIGLRKPIVHVRFNGDIPNVYDQLTTLIGDRGHFFPSLMHQEKAQEVRVGPQNTFQTLLAAKFENQITQEYNDTLRLFQAGARWKEELALMESEAMA